MTAEQERRAEAIRAIERFCAENQVSMPALEEKRVEGRIELRGVINGRDFGVAYEVGP